MRTPLAILIASILVLSAAGLAIGKGNDGRDHPGADAREDHHAEAMERGGKLLFHDDNVAVLFHENRNHAAPDFRVMFNGTNDSDAGYRVKILSVYEASRNDTSGGHGLPRDNLARMADWNVQSVPGNGTLTLTMTRADAQAITTLVWHLDTANKTVKFDLNVENWRWANASDVLILDMLVQGHDLKNATGDKVSVEDAGYISWANTATATYGNATGTLQVQAFQGKAKGGDDEKGADDESAKEKSEGQSGKGGHLYLVFNGTGGYSKLAYDPELGVQSSSASTQTVPFMAPLLIVATVAGLALLVARRKA
ncbi:MAG: hypothetical protein QOE90_1866 [Thermoplasmata archaeon]|jgi:hypothetical protein|nr:hypothetical protein [Thermoplasmata archaeon]